MKRVFTSLLATLGFGTAAQAQNATPPEVMAELRARALAVRPTDIGLAPDEFTERPWGLLMETGLQGGAVYSLVVLADGSTSLYFSTGGGVIGAGGHEAVRAASKSMLETAMRLQFQAQVASLTPLPGRGRVHFYLLTAHGTLSYSADEQGLGQGNDRMSELFHAGHAVIAQVRLNAEARSQGRRQ